MWETWELQPAKPLVFAENSNSFIEPTIEQMSKLFDGKQFRSGYKEGMTPVVLPVSLDQFKQIFINNDAPYFMDKLLAEVGNTIVQVDPWTSILPTDPQEFKTFGSDPV